MSEAKTPLLGGTRVKQILIEILITYVKVTFFYIWYPLYLRCWFMECVIPTATAASLV